jgi:transposase InsO family protein
MGLTLTTDNGTQFTSARYVDIHRQLCITHRCTGYNHPEGNSYIATFHRSLKEEEVWPNEYQNFDQPSRASPTGKTNTPCAWLPPDPFCFRGDVLWRGKQCTS